MQMSPSISSGITPAAVPSSLVVKLHPHQILCACTTQMFLISPNEAYLLGENDCSWTDMTLTANWLT